MILCAGCPTGGILKTLVKNLCSYFFYIEKWSQKYRNKMIDCSGGSSCPLSPLSGQFYMMNVLENQWLPVTISHLYLNLME